MQQHTLAQETVIRGIGLHSGCDGILTLKPAPVGHGIVFRRVDLPGTPLIPALYSNVVDTRNCTCLGDGAGNVVSTVEHLMAALAVLEVDNVLIEINNQETPIMDGSALPFFRALQKAGTVAQEAPRKYLRLLRSVEFVDEKGNRIKAEPSDDFEVHFEIEFPSKIVGHQEFSGQITPEIFAAEIAPCRTFCEKYQLDGEKILNPGGFRVENECVNHKVIDAVGDMYTSGYPLLAKITAEKTGHFHNNELLKKIFADEANYRIV